MPKYISVTETAKVIREELKKAFSKRDYPGLKFSVKSEKYSMGASIDIYWVDGPGRSEVEAITNRFEGKTFDAIQDLANHKSDNWKGIENYKEFVIKLIVGNKWAEIVSFDNYRARNLEPEKGL